jgi:hypothetical protein
MDEVSLAIALQQALEAAGDTHTPADVAAAIERGDAQLLTDHDGRAFMITEVLQYPRKRVLRLWLAGGRLTALRTLAPQLEQLAREQGCDAMEAAGRAGWMDEAGLHGWTPTAVVYGKELAT